MILECNLSHRFLHVIRNCKEKAGLLKVWELLAESGGVFVMVKVSLAIQNQLLTGTEQVRSINASKLLKH